MLALVAVVSHSSRSIYLDPALRVGDRIKSRTDDDVRILRISESGHCGEHAEAIAHRARTAGWSVTVREVDDLPVELVLKPLGSHAAVRNEGDGMAIDLFGPPVDRAVPRSEPNEPRKTNANFRKKRCLDCGMVSNAGNLQRHVRGSGHVGSEWLEGQDPRA